MKRVSTKQRLALRRRLRALINDELERRAAVAATPDPATRRVRGRRGRADSDSTFASYMDLPRQTVSSWFTGKNEPSLPQLTRISERTGVSLDWLLFGDGGETPVRRGQRPSPEFLDELAARVLAGVESAATRGELVPGERYDVWTCDPEGILAWVVQEQIATYRRFSEWQTKLRRVYYAVDPLDPASVHLVRLLRKGEERERYMRRFDEARHRLDVALSEVERPRDPLIWPIGRHLAPIPPWPPAQFVDWGDGAISSRDIPNADPRWATEFEPSGRRRARSAIPEQNRANDALGASLVTGGPSTDDGE